jgi:hypothetical protein
VGWLPPDLCPSGAGLGSRREGFLQPHNAQRGLCHTGAATLLLVRAGDNLSWSIVGQSSVRAASVRHGDLAGDGPDEGRHGAGDRHHDLIDIFAAGHQAPIAFTEADLCFPTNILDGFGHFF